MLKVSAVNKINISCLTKWLACHEAMDSNDVVFCVSNFAACVYFDCGFSTAH